MKKLSIILLIGFTSAFLFGQVGQLSGVVSSDNEGLAGANVILEGTPYGTAANVAGEYFIDNVPAGDYTVTVTYVGYANESQEVTINAGEESQVNFSLRTSATDSLSMDLISSSSIISTDSYPRRVENSPCT